VSKSRLPKDFSHNCRLEQLVAEVEESKAASEVLVESLQSKKEDLVGTVDAMSRELKIATSAVFEKSILLSQCADVADEVAYSCRVQEENQTLQSKVLTMTATISDKVDLKRMSLTRSRRNLSKLSARKHSNWRGGYSPSRSSAAASITS
jgi:hypothetical protein